MNMYKIIGLTIVLIFIFSGCEQLSGENSDISNGKESVSCKALYSLVSEDMTDSDLKDTQQEVEAFVQEVLGYEGRLSMEDACTYNLYNSFMLFEDYYTIMDFDRSDTEIHEGINAFAKEYNIKNIDILYELLKLERAIMNQ